jgi:hypothetical protein
MTRKLLIMFFLFLYIGTLNIYSENTGVSCSIKNNNDKTAQDKLVAYIWGDETVQDLNLKFMIDHPDNTQISAYLEDYERGIYCTSSLDEFGFENKRIGEECSENYENFFYLSNFVNGIFSKDFNSLYNYKVCIYSTNYVTNDLILTEKDLSGLGYSCLFKAVNDTNAKVSSCENEDFYKYLWMRVFSTKQLSSCTSSCKNSQDNRVYYACSQKIKECENMPIECNGALYGSWIKISSSEELKCAPPWTDFRTTSFSDDSVNLDTTNTNCETIIKKKIPFKYNNEIIDMVVVMCEKED